MLDLKLTRDCMIHVKNKNFTFIKVLCEERLLHVYVGRYI